MIARGLYWTIFLRRNRGAAGVFAATAVFLVVYAILFPGLFSVSSVAKQSEVLFPLAVAAMGQTLVMLTGGIDLALGALVSLGTVITATRLGGGVLADAGGIGLVLAVGAAIGALTGLLVTKLRLPPIIVTLATSFIWTGVALLILPTPGGYVPRGLSDALAGDLPVPLVMLAVLVLLWKLVALTPLGLAITAAGDNDIGAYRSGLAVDRARTLAYAIAGALATLAGFYVAVETGSGDPTIGAPYTLNSITAAVLGGVAFTGGVGTMRGAISGALLLTILIAVLFFLGLPPFYQYLAQGFVILAAVSIPLLRRA